MPRLTNRTALITGSSSGIGRATALLFASEGAIVVCADLTESTWRRPASTSSLPPSSRPQPQDPPDPDPSIPTHELIRTRFGADRATFVSCDVTIASSVEAAVAHAVAASPHGRLDIMINNAGIAIGASDGKGDGRVPIWELETEAFERQQRINVLGVFHGVKFAARQMVSQTAWAGEDWEGRGGEGGGGKGGEARAEGKGRSRGWIVNAGSVLGSVAVPGTAAYVTSKGAIASLTRAAALDCAEYGVHVNAVNPGYVRTRLTDSALAMDGVEGAVKDLHPLGGIGEPEDVARVYLFLVSEDARWVTGVNLPVDGGYLLR